MLIELLRNDATIKTYVCEDCSENNTAVEIGDDVDRNDLIIIKVDNYYNHLIKDPDNSPDCLIIQRCSDNNYNIIIVELRDISGPYGFEISKIYKKFITCLEDFMSNKFGNYFHNQLFNFLSIKLLFVTDPYGFKEKPEKQLKMRGTKIDSLLARRIPKFFNKHLYLEHMLPNPRLRSCREG